MSGLHTPSASPPSFEFALFPPLEDEDWGDVLLLLAMLAEDEKMAEEAVTPSTDDKKS